MSPKTAMSAAGFEPRPDVQWRSIEVTVRLPMLPSYRCCCTLVLHSLEKFKQQLGIFMAQFPDLPPCNGYFTPNSNSMLEWASSNHRNLQSCWCRRNFYSCDQDENWFRIRFWPYLIFWVVFQKNNNSLLVLDVRT